MVETSSETTPEILNVAAYRFVALEEEVLPEWRAAMRERADELELRGTILLSPEGINLMLAGVTESLRSFLAWLADLDERFADFEIKESYSDRLPFTRMLVKVKREIIAFGVPGISPADSTAPHLPPETLKRWLDEGKDLVLLDTRNDYEIRLGTFRGARDLDLETFREFPGRAADLEDVPRDQTVVTFCTGGIRCEKAAALLLKNAFSDVHQLHGGILRYFEKCGDAHYDGECFVYDRRVSLDAKLEETQTVQCFKCQMPVSVEEQELPTYVPDVSCPACYEEKRES